MSESVIKEIEGDLFSADDSYSMCHCVAADMKMGMGIAVKFRNKFGRLNELLQQKVNPGGVAILKDKNRYIYNLVTKQRSWDKPTYQLLHSSLSAMRHHMVNHGVTKLALPRIGCGLDGLEWSKVKELLQELFATDAVELIVFNYVLNKNKKQ